jgi:hypothetical protein
MAGTILRISSDMSHLNPVSAGFVETLNGVEPGYCKQNMRGDGDKVEVCPCCTQSWNRNATKADAAAKARIKTENSSTQSQIVEECNWRRNVLGHAKQKKPVSNLNLLKLRVGINHKNIQNTTRSMF